MPLTQELVKIIQVEYLMTLSSLLKLGQIDVSTARATAQTFLKYLPFTDLEDLETKIKDFVSKYKLFNKLDIVVMQKAEEGKTSEVLEKMTLLMKQNKLDEALEIAK